VELGAPSLECESWPGLSLQVDKLSSIERHTRGRRHCKGEGGRRCTARGAEVSGVALPLFLFLGRLVGEFLLERSFLHMSQKSSYHYTTRKVTRKKRNVSIS
jgi:hypothetical protein